jgi:hypothetical protein
MASHECNRLAPADAGQIYGGPGALSHTFSPEADGRMGASARQPRIIFAPRSADREGASEGVSRNVGPSRGGYSVRCVCTRHLGALFGAPLSRPPLDKRRSDRIGLTVRELQRARSPVFDERWGRPRARDNLRSLWFPTREDVPDDRVDYGVEDKMPASCSPAEGRNDDWADRRTGSRPNTDRDDTLRRTGGPSRRRRIPIGAAVSGATERTRDQSPEWRTIRGLSTAAGDPGQPTDSRSYLEAT